MLLLWSKHSALISSKQTDLKLGHFLDIDDMTSPGKSGEVPEPDLHVLGCSVCYRPAFYSTLQSVL